MSAGMDDLVALAPLRLISEAARESLGVSLEADRDLDWDPVDLSGALRDHVRRALRWSLLAAAAARRVSDLDVELRALRARLDAQAREVLGRSVPRATEPMVLSCIESDPSFVAAQRALHEAAAEARLLDDLRALFRDRKDLLLAALGPGAKR